MQNRLLCYHGQVGSTPACRVEFSKVIDQFSTYDSWFKNKAGVHGGWKLVSEEHQVNGRRIQFLSFACIGMLHHTSLKQHKICFNLILKHRDNKLTFSPSSLVLKMSSEGEQESTLNPHYFPLIFFFCSLYC